MQLQGLVIAGGKSSRMETDKAWLNYHGQPQLFHLYQLLQPFCTEVSISCNRQQAAIIPGDYNIVQDAAQYENKGPISALLSAFESAPGKDLLVIGCDYPFIQQQQLQAMLNSIVDVKKVTTFYNEAAQLYEPLIGFYPAACYQLLQEQFEQHNFSIQYFLRLSNANKFLPADAIHIKSVDTPDAFEAAKKQLQQTIVK